MAPKKRDLARNAVAKDVDTVLSKVRRLRENDRKRESKANQGPQLKLKDIVSVAVREVTDKDDDEVARSIEKLFLDIAGSILEDKGFEYLVPNRSASNQIYVEQLDRIVLKDNVSARAFGNVSQVRKMAIMTKILEQIHQLCRKGIHSTKRDVFYTDVKLFKKQTESDAMFDDVATMLGATRSSLNVIASEKGVVVGKLRFNEDGDAIDCTKMGTGGKAIPPHLDKVTDIEGEAEFILLVEKDAAFMRLAEDRFYNRYPCVIMTAKGQPDIASRMFLKKVKATLKIPVLGLFDADPYGLKILSVYMKGSKNMSYDSANLTTSDIKWLGILPSDLDKYKIPPQCRLPMTPSDIETGKKLLEEDFIKKNPAWVHELEIMVKTKEKAEIQALSSFGIQYLTEQYLPRKIKEASWL